MPNRFQPLGDDDWPEAAADLRDGFAGRLNVYRTMAHHPDLLAAWAPLRGHVVQSSVLTPEQSEIVILRTGHHLGAEYEWAHHVVRGRKAGLSDDRIAAQRGPIDRMQGDDALLAGAVDELFARRRMAPETIAAVHDRLGPQAVLDVMATVGFYNVLGFIVNSFDTPLDDDVAAELARNPAPAVPA
ncbi:carboxymuconolactone decarboxylase family protein [uncultured Paracoccus sp.]|uniref:carboxymuconolactone decarboxylase family protein n=1 Tax=uncultured Paracoccus sp. TaxID=189685 RepID=UPI002606F040|nr:carboxymuconolactone decarboxylase family protein [uncultured Paracoccus sp.]